MKKARCCARERRRNGFWVVSDEKVVLDRLVGQEKPVVRGS